MIHENKLMSSDHFVILVMIALIKRKVIKLSAN